MVEVAVDLAAALAGLGVDVHEAGGVHTKSHAFALRVGEQHGGRGGDATARHLRQANLLTCAIGLPAGGDAGLRIGLNEMVRWGMTSDDVPELAQLVTDALGDEPESIAPKVTAFRQRFTELRYATLR